MECSALAMGAGQPLLVYDAAFEEARERRAHHRRVGDGRGPSALGLRLDPLFAATLVNHVAAPERRTPKSYAPRRALRAGVAVDVRA